MSRAITFIVYSLLTIMVVAGTINSPAVDIFTSASSTGPYGSPSGGSVGIIAIGFTMIMILLFYQSAFNTGGHRQQQQTVTPPDPPQYPEDDGPDPFRDDQNLETGTGTFTDSTTDTEILDDEPDPFRDDIGGRDPEYDDEFQEILDELDGEIEDDWQR